MINSRGFLGGRDKSSEKSIAATIMRLEFEKKGRLDPTERFKLIMKMKMDRAKKEHDLNKNSGRSMSKRAEQAIKDIAAKKAAKEAKKLRQMVIIKPEIYNNGRLTKKGQVYDVAGNMVASINKKNGKISTMLGASLGKYKPHSRPVANTLMGAINQYSPYYINLRKLQAMQAAGIDPVTGQSINQTTINVHGNHGHMAAMHGGNYSSHGASERAQAGYDNAYGEAAGGPRQQIGATAWGAVSSNVWGTFTDNAWGTSFDTVWGTNQSDVWGGIGGSPYAGSGAGGAHIYATGDNAFFKGIEKFIRRLFGMPTGDAGKKLDAFRQARMGASNGGSSGTRSVSTPTRASAPAPRTGR
jgi:hypothetical protein